MRSIYSVNSFIFIKYSQIPTNTHSCTHTHIQMHAWRRGEDDREYTLRDRPCTDFAIFVNCTHEIRFSAWPDVHEVLKVYALPGCSVLYTIYKYIHICEYMAQKAATCRGRHLSILWLQTGWTGRSLV